MKIKKLLPLFISLLISINLVSCKGLTKNIDNNNVLEKNTEENISKETENNNIIEEKEPEKPASFTAFDKTYNSSKDLSAIEVDTNIYDDRHSISYTAGEYKEIDFIYDLLYLYLNQDESVYNSLVSYDETSLSGYAPLNERDKEKLQKDLVSLREQMELVDGEEMIVRLDKVTYTGSDSIINSGNNFYIRVAISRVGATVVPWNFFDITVFENDNKLVAHLL